VPITPSSASAKCSGMAGVCLRSIFVILCRLRDQRNRTLRKIRGRQKLDLGPMGEDLSWLEQPKHQLAFCGRSAQWMSNRQMSAFGGKADMTFAVRNVSMTQSGHPSFRANTYVGIGTRKRKLYLGAMRHVISRNNHARLKSKSSS